MAKVPNRWRVVVIRPNGSVGSTYHCTTLAQKTLIVLVLKTNNHSFQIEEFCA